MNCIIDYRHGEVRKNEDFCEACCKMIEKIEDTKIPIEAQFDNSNNNLKLSGGKRKL